MPGTHEELATYWRWAEERWLNNEDPGDTAAFIVHLRRLGGDTTRLRDYGFPYEVKSPSFPLG